MKRFYSLRVGLPSSVLAVLVFLSFLSYLSMIEDSRKLMFEQARSSALVQSEAIARLAQWDLSVDPSHVAAEIAAHATERKVVVLALIDSNAVIEMAHRSEWVRRPASEIIPGFDLEHFERVTTGHLPDIKTDEDGLHVRVMVPFQTLQRDNSIRPARRGVTFLDYDLNYENAMIQADARQHWLIEVAVVGLIAIFLSLFLYMRISRPLVRVQKASEKLAFGDDVNLQIPVTGPYEIRQLATAHNQMVAKLTDARQQAETGREQLAAIMDSVNDAIITTDSERRVRVINQAALRMFGFTEEAVKGQLIEELIPERFRAMHGKSILKFSENRSRPMKAISSRQVTALRANGEEFPVYVAISSLQVNGETLFTAILHDVSEELRAQHAIRELNASLETQVEQRTAKLMETTLSLEFQKAELEATHAQLQTIFDTASTGIMLLNNRNIIRCNNKAEEVFGFGPGEMIGMNTRCWYSDEKTYLKAGHDFYSQFQGHQLSVIETPAIRRDGTNILVRFSGRITRDTPEAQELVVIVEDITQEAQAKELLLRAKEDAEQASQAKSFFVANMSHEIRTPMNGILGLAYVLEKSNIPEEARQLVKKIRSTGANLQGIISDILDFSKIEGGYLDIEKTAFDLGDVLDRLADTMASNAGEKPIELAIIPPPCRDFSLQGDPLRLQQILVNLAGNAIKFTSRGFVKLKVEALSEDDLQVVLRFTVSDSGIGISAINQAQIFKPFTQADISTTRRFGGSGLGLSISRRLVDLMGGTLEVSSTEGVGSEFFFSLRLVRSKPQPGNHSGLQGVNVLLSSQCPVFRESLQATANSLGLNPQVFEPGESMRQYLNGLNPELLPQQVLVLDSTLEADALETVRSLQQQVSPTAGPLVLLVRGHTQSDLLTQVNHLQIDAELTKPLTPSRLHEAITLALRKRHGDRDPYRQDPGQRLVGLKILVVDDSDIGREVSQRIFSDEGAEVITCNDGQQGLTWLQTPGNEVDLVLMDLQMPIMDGYEATRAIRKQSRFQQLPVIALTAGAFQTQRNAAQAAGLNDFLSKPFDVEMAVAMMLRYVRRNRSLKSKAIVSPSQPIFAPVPNSSLDLPGLKIGRGLSVWKDAAVYQRFLRKFAVDYQDCVNVMQHATPQDSSRLAHKLLGAASNLALDDVALAAAEIDQSVHDGQQPPAKLDELEQAMKIALHSISIYAYPPTPAESVKTEEFSLQKLTELLVAVLKSLAQDSPAGVEPILPSLEKYLSLAQVLPLRTALDNFDFRGAEACVHALAEELGICIVESSI